METLGTHEHSAELSAELSTLPAGLSTSQSHSQLLTALRAAHRELHKERQTRERVESKSVKVLDRLRKGMAVVERQRERIATLEARAKAAEKVAEGRGRQLQEASAQAGALNQVLETLNPHNDIEPLITTGGASVPHTAPTSMSRGRPELVPLARTLPDIHSVR